jgi:hypothetical protein
MQTKRASLVETLTGTLVGMILAIVAGQYVIYPAFGWHPHLGDNLWMTACFTAVGLIRSYLWRRFFNWLDR